MDQAKHQDANIIRKFRDGICITQKIAGLVAMLLDAGLASSNIVCKLGFEYYHGNFNLKC